MGTPGTSQLDLGALLGNQFSNIELIKESLYKTVWQGEQNQRRLAIHCLSKAHLSAAQIEAFLTMWKRLAEANLGFLPKHGGLIDGEERLLLTEEWISGVSWSQAVRSREKALKFGAELLDILAELETLELPRYQFDERDLIVEEETGRLIFLGLTRAPNTTPLSGDLSAHSVLGLLEPYLSEHERASLREQGSCVHLAQSLRRLDVSPVLNGRLDPPLLGREQALETLNQALASGGIQFVQAPAGGGKTRLLQDWSRKVQGRVLWAKSDREVAPTPFKLFREPLGQLDREIDEDSELASLLEQTLNVRPPLLSSLSKTSRDGPLRATVIWLTRLFTLLGSHRPTLLILDDAQWADRLTLHFLEIWAQEGKNALVVAAFRQEDLDPTHALRQRYSQTLSLPPLSDQQAEQLLRVSEPLASPTLIESARRRAEGNPFLLLQFLRTSEERGDLFEARLSNLKAETKTALGVASVLGREFSLDLLRACAGEEASLEEAISEGMLRLEGDSCQFTHDRWRDAASALIHPDLVKTVHQRAALHLRQTSASNVFEIAFHFAASGEPEKGLEEALKAAHLARAEHDLTASIFYLELALKAQSEDSPKFLSTNLALGDCFRLTGNYSESRLKLQAALELSRDPHEKTEILLLLGDVHFKEDSLELARENIIQGLKLQGEKIPKSFLLALVKEIGVQATQGLLHRFKRPVKTLESSPKDLMRVSLYNRLAYILWFFEGPIPSIWAHFKELNIAERYQDSPQLCRAWANHAIAMSALPWWKRAHEYGERAVTSARKLGDRWVQGQAAHFGGAVLLGAGRLTEARKLLEESTRLLAETGDRWEENGARYHLGLTYYCQGALEKAVLTARETHRTGLEINDRLAAGDNLYTWARAAQGNLPSASLEREKQFVSLDLQRTCELLSAEALMELRQRNPERAATLLSEAWNTYQKRNVSHFYASSIPCWLATAQRLCAQKSEGPRRRQRLAQVASTLRRAESLARRYRTNLPHVLREKGLHSFLLGNIKAAARYLRESREAAVELGMSFEAELTAAFESRLLWLHQERNEPPTLKGALRAETDWLLCRESRAWHWSYEELLELGRWSLELSDCLSADTALHKLMKASCQLFSLDEAIIVEVTDGKLTVRIGMSENVPRAWPTTEETRWQFYPVSGMDSSRNQGLLVRATGRELPLNEVPLLEYLVNLTSASIKKIRRLNGRRSGPLDEPSLALSASGVTPDGSLLLTDKLIEQERRISYLMHDLKTVLTHSRLLAEKLSQSSAPESESRLLADQIVQADLGALQLLEDHRRSEKTSLGPKLPLSIDLRLQRMLPLLESLCGQEILLLSDADPVPALTLDPIAFDRLILNLTLFKRGFLDPTEPMTLRILRALYCTDKPGQPDEVPAGQYLVLEIKDEISLGGAPQNLQPLKDLLERLPTRQSLLQWESGGKGPNFKVHFPIVPSKSDE